MTLALSEVHAHRGDARKALELATAASSTMRQIGEAQKAFDGAGEMLKAVRSAAPLLESLGDSKLEARMMEIKTHANQVSGNADEALSAAQRERELALQLGDKIEEGAALNNTAFSYCMKPDGVQGALQAATQAVEVSRTTGDWREEDAALGTAVNACCALQRMREALRWQQQRVDLHTRRGDRAAAREHGQLLAAIRSHVGGRQLA